MNLLANTKENNAKVNALKKIAETKWVGNTIQDNLEKCLVGLNIGSTNSGWYNPIAVKIDGLYGYYMINQDGSIFCESRIIKEGDKKYRIEHMTNEAWNKFEELYIDFLNKN